MKSAIIVAALLILAILSAAGFAVAYAVWPQTQLAAGLLAVALGALAAAVVVYEHQLMPTPQAIEDRGELPSGAAANDAAASTFLEGACAAGGSRPWLLRLFAGAIATLGIAALFPLRSLAPPGASPAKLRQTSWRKGSRLVRADGSLVRADDLGVDSVVTVFPEGHVGPEFANEMVNDATVLVRVGPHELRLPPERASWAPGDLLAFSKVCTHAGCPVGLYRAAARQLFCPCHQSTFDVLTGGTRIFGPAARALPQLPLTLAEDGTIQAQSDYPDPIGPGYWERA
jgi:ubiquinol-cytochrome c reductase iron-sulfur subunit